MLIAASVNLQETPENQIVKMILAGADILRYNLAYNDINEITDFVEHILRIKENLQSDIKIMVDFPINKIRLGDFENQYFSVKENDELYFQSAPYSPDCNNFVPVETKKLGESVQNGQIISLANGRMTVQVIEIVNSETIKAKILNNGFIKTRQTFNIGTHIPDAEMLQKYKNILSKVLVLDEAPEYAAMSYVNENFYKLLKETPEILQHSGKTKFAIKVENELTDQQIHELCKNSFPQMIIFDRGEIGVNFPYEKTGVYQKRFLSITRHYAKPVLVSTQILYSTMDNYIPTRSDILDLTNIIIDGASGIIMGKETSHNRRPVYAISVAKRIIAEAEKFNKHQEIIWQENNGQSEANHTLPRSLNG